MIDTIVVGGGIAGLCAAAEAARAGQRVEVLDAHGVGGRARTSENGGYLFNTGPHAVYIGGALHTALADFGIAAPGGIPPTAGGVYQVGEELHGFPSGARSLLTTSGLGIAGKLRAARWLGGIARLDTRPLVGRTVGEWLADQPRDLARLLHALVRLSTYTDLPDSMDAGVAAAQVKSGVTTGVRYLDGGWRTIVDGLRGVVQSNRGVVREHVEVASVDAGSGVAVHLADGTSLEARHVVIATGGPGVAARLCCRPVGGAERLGPPVEAACLDLALRRVPERSFILGADRPLYLSLHAPTARLAPDGGALLSVMRYLRPGEEPPAHATTRAEFRELATVAGVRDADVVVERYLARSTVYHGVPLAVHGGLAGRPGVDGLGLADVSIAGDWVGPDGLLADASAASGRAAARRATGS